MRIKTVVHPDRLVLLGKARDIRLALQSLQLICGASTPLIKLIDQSAKFKYNIQ